MQYIKIHYFANQQATSLINLLIATVISGIIMLLMFNLYVLINKQTIFLQQKLNFLYKQDIANFFIRKNIEYAGYKGPASAILMPETSSINYQFNNHIYITPKAPLATCITDYNNCKNFVTKKILQKIINKHIKPNTSILLAYDIAEQINTLSKSMRHIDEPLYVNKPNNIRVGDQLIIADYYNIERFIVSNIDNNYLYHDRPYNISGLMKKFEQNAEIFKTKNIAFYIAKSNNYNKKNWSLYMEDFSNKSRAEAILDNIEDLKVEIIDPINKKITQIINSWIFEKYVLICIDNIIKIGAAIHNGY